MFEYRLGDRSALDWVIDQYQVSEDKRSGIHSDPNRDDDPEYIVRLVGQVVRERWDGEDCLQAAGGVCGVIAAHDLWVARIVKRDW